MKWVENAGLVKFDILGLNTLTLISKTIKILKYTNVKNAYVQTSKMALTIAGLANENHLDCSFTMGFFPSNHNDNALISTDEKFLMAVSVGVADNDVDYSKADSTKRKEFNKYSNIFKFK